MEEAMAALLWKALLWKPVLTGSPGRWCGHTSWTTAPWPCGWSVGAARP